jgi:universal stress protein A
VMKTHGRHGIAHFIIGSVAKHVVREAPCPVLTLTSAEKERFLKP